MEERGKIGGNRRCLMEMLMLRIQGCLLLVLVRLRLKV